MFIGSAENLGDPGCRNSMLGVMRPQWDDKYRLRLIFAPKRVLEYVVVHELAHLRYRSHARNLEVLGADIAELTLRQGVAGTLIKLGSMKFLKRGCNPKCVGRSLDKIGGGVTQRINLSAPQRRCCACDLRGK